MDAKWHYFYVVATTGNMNRAAQLLGISPAAVSKAVSRLELELDCRLIIPSGRGFALTDKGAQVAEQAKELLSQFEAVKRQIRNPSLNEKPVTLATFEVFSTYFLGQMVSRFGLDEPLQCYELGPGAIENCVASGACDFGITYIPIPQHNLDFLKVATLKMRIFGSSSQAEISNLEQCNFVVPISPIQGAPNRMQGLDGWPEHLVLRKIKYRVTLMETALELVRQNKAVVYLPAFISNLHNRQVKEKFQLFPLEVKTPFPSKLTEQSVYLVKRKTTEESSVSKKICAAIRSIIASKESST